MFDSLEIRPPGLFAGIAITLFVQETESLAWRTADYNISLGNLINPVLDDLLDIVRGTVFAEIGGVGVKVIGPDGSENLSKCLRETKRQSAYLVLLYYLKLIF